MILGFTGTREGMTRLQSAMFVGVLARTCPTEFHHGDCLGADAEAHALVREHAPRCRIVIHPGNVDALRAHCEGDEIRRPMAFMTRNIAIVMACEEMAATPKSRAEEIRSGTWSTIRMARRAGKVVHMVWP